MNRVASNDRAPRRLALEAGGVVCALALAALSLQGQPAPTNAATHPPAATNAPARPAAAQAAPARARTDFNAFRLIAERNIFNAARSGGRVNPPPRDIRRPARTDSLALVGVMSYERGPFAFFDGSSPEFRKALQPGGTVAGFQVLEIRPNGVRLDNGTNQFELRVGARLRHEDQGPWQLSESTEPLSAAAAGSASSPGGAESSNDAAEEVLRRLLQRREQETR